MTQEELFREFQARGKEKRESLNKSDCPEGYAFEEYQEGWRSAFSWATHILAKLISDHSSLPSNLDEAAKEYADSMGLKGFDKVRTISDFKAGTEWMAKQGVTLNISIDELSCEAYNACVEQGLTSKDEVVVQIRKK